MDLDNEMDDATAALILQLQIQDAAEAFQIDSYQSDDLGLTDSQIAMNSYRRELELNYSIVRDRIMTKSIAQACRTDGPEVTNLISGEQVIERDEGVSIIYGDAEPHDLFWGQSLDEKGLDQESLHESEILSDYSYQMRDYPNEIEATPHEGPNLSSHLVLCDYSSADPSTTSESSRRALRGKSVEEIHGNCISCQETFPSRELAQCPCNHEYCSACLSEFIQASINDDGCFPPRCCKQPILLANVHTFLSPELIVRFESKKIEIESQDRTYCSNQVCSTFIRPEYIQMDQAVCPECETVTCVICKAASHNGDCPADTALQGVLELAKENRWQRCFNCRRIIELQIGCNHMTCPCGTEFCYVCAERWKTCNCPQWEEALLLTHPDVFPNPNPLPEDVIGPVEELAQVDPWEPREMCVHHQWRFLRGRHQCEQCFHTLPSYIFQCRHCSFISCNRCRRNTS